ncbi:unnamed protein product [Acanthoscelides obtectus]|uniref:Uncharacterized protein n=1 Tax=Acanthoscelides obtectus TaxID=200917 RepID=A0A9P0KEV7_ACAOB|nr:unnamed protein product [Acanthoscelides obtectus]CAK1635230.1 hypothetical protein AOBTE_LOCUS9146 [Acanthoscelides obtectus]
MDLKVKDFLETLTKERITDDSIIVFFSDHGIRYGDILLYNTGWHEERLPFIYFSFPTWFKRKYPRLLNNFKANMHRLTSPYDFYMTLQHVLLLEGKISEFKPSIACPTCKSFFDEIPHNRSCKDAGIPTHYCTCQGYLEVRLSQDVAQHAAQLLIDEVHSRIKDIPSCLRYKLLRVRRTAVSQNSLLENETYLLMSIETIPTAIFEATFIVSGDISRKDISLAENRWISRLDPTGGNDWCTKNFKIYCFCPKKH